MAALSPSAAGSESSVAAGEAASGVWRTRWRRDPLLPIALLLQSARSLPGMATRPLWLDEAFTAVTSRGGWSDIRGASMHDNGPALHCLLLHGWRAIAGESPLALRLPSLWSAREVGASRFRLARWLPRYARLWAWAMAFGLRSRRASA